MNTIDPKCHNNERCPKRDTCGRRSDTHNEHEIYASYFILGAEQCSGYRPAEEK
jgi:hypothetical protein